MPLDDHEYSPDDENLLQPLHVIQQLLLLCYYAGEIEASAWEHYLQQHPALVAYCRGYGSAGKQSEMDEVATG